MSINTFGRLLRMTTWGESHGPAIGVIVDGCPPNIMLSEKRIQPWLDERRPGASRLTSQRREPDRVRILSGVYDGRTTGTPISLIIDNEDARSKDYDRVGQAFRPGHADYSYQAKYGIRDPRGGGRASARETAARVAAGAIARLIIPEVRIQAYLVEVGGDAIDRGVVNAETAATDFPCPDAAAAARWQRNIEAARKSGNSLGGIVECVADGVPAGWGSPIYAKLDAELAAALMGVNAVKGVEVGDGFAAARASGTDNADEMREGPGTPQFESNHAGGILGGISTGQPIICRAAFKPTPSILAPLRSVDASGKDVEVSTGGRHDPCVALRAPPIVEAMVALVLADHKLLHLALSGHQP